MITCVWPNAPAFSICHPVWFMRLTRRTLLQGAASSLTLPAALLAARELRFDVAIIGGGTGGCAAALAACRAGKRSRRQVYGMLVPRQDWELGFVA